MDHLFYSRLRKLSLHCRLPLPLGSQRQVSPSPSCALLHCDQATCCTLLNSLLISTSAYFVTDEKNDHRSLERKLPRSLFLVVKRNRAEDPWQFPQGKLKEGETLRMVNSKYSEHLVSKIICE
jgi:hypothetical protein